jgi:hypothetical protein
MLCDEDGWTAFAAEPSDYWYEYPLYPFGNGKSVSMPSALAALSALEAQIAGERPEPVETPATTNGTSGASGAAGGAGRIVTLREGVPQTIVAKRITVTGDNELLLHD